MINTKVSGGAGAAAATNTLVLIMQVSVISPLVRLLAAAFVAADSLLVDAFGNEDVAPNLLGIAAPPLGILVLTGLYTHLTARRPGRLLDVGYALNVAGLCLVTAVDFTRTFVLQRLDDGVVDDLVAAGPTRPALFAAAFVYIAGTVVLGVALAAAGSPSRPPGAVAGLSWRLLAEARDAESGHAAVAAAA